MPRIRAPSHRNKRIDFIQPGELQQNAYVERYNRLVLYDWLADYLFKRSMKFRISATRCFWTYDEDRPNMELGGIAQKQKLALLV